MEKPRDFGVKLIQTQTMALPFASCKAPSRSLILSAFSLLICGVLIDGSYLVEELWLAVLQLAYKIFTVSEPQLVIKSDNKSSPSMVWPVRYYHPWA